MALTNSIFAMVDVLWVAHLGAHAVAIVGLTESMMMIIYSVAVGVAIGATALVARRIGEKEISAAGRTAAQTIMVAAVIAIALGAAGAAFAPELLRMMGADEHAVAQGHQFTRVMLGGNVTVFLLFVINAIFRGAGDAAFAMRVLLLGNTLNILLAHVSSSAWGRSPSWASRARRWRRTSVAVSPSRIRSTCWPAAGAGSR